MMYHKLINNTLSFMSLVLWPCEERLYAQKKEKLICLTASLGGCLKALRIIKYF